MKRIIVTVAMILSLLVLTAQTDEEYTWQNATINGGGYVTGFSFSPVAKGLLYARTDMGGAYRWNHGTKKWIPITDKFTSWGHTGILSIAADPVDSNRVYIAVGNTGAAFYYSTDRGDNWTQGTLPIAGMQLWGNGIGRASGERLQVDPNKPNILFLGTNQNGLLRSDDFGATWKVVSSFPRLKTMSVGIDASSSVKGQASTDIYVCTNDHYRQNDTTATGLKVSGDTLSGGIYVSRDAGLTWALLENQPTKILPKTWFAAKNQVATPAIPYQMAFAGDFIYFTFGEHDKIPNCNPNNGGSCNNGGLYKFDKTSKTWKELFPDQHNAQGAYCAVAVHPTNKNVVLVGTLGQYYPKFDQLFSTIDGGTTWVRLFSTATFLPSNSPFAGPSPNWLTGIQINPFDGNHFVYGSGKGVYMSFDFENVLAKKPISFGYASDGIEQTYVATLVSPTAGANLLSGLGDIMGFRHADLSVSPPMTYVPSHGNCANIDYAQNKPDTIVRTHGGGNNNGSISLDQGLTWKKFETTGLAVKTTEQYGKIAISPDGKRIVWSHLKGNIAYSTNNGQSWTPSTAPVVDAVYEVLSDRVNSNTFYYPRFNEGKLYRSTDGGATFVATAGSFGTASATYDTDIAVAIGFEGNVWIAIPNKGLYYTSNGGASFTKVANITAARRVALGAPATPGGYPSIYIDGHYNGIRSFYRSDDKGLTWVNIKGDKWFGNNVVCIGADSRIYGRMYLGTNGRGILYGDIVPQCTATITANGATTFCQGGSVTLTASAGSTYKWMNGTEAAGTTQAITVNSAGSYTVEVTHANGCKATSDTTKTVVHKPENITFNYQVNTNAWVKGTNATLCPGDKFQFAAWPVSGSTWVWTGPNGFSSSIRNPLIAAVTDNSYGTYTAAHTDANGCSSTAQFTITKGTCPVMQTIALQKGWNLISTNLSPADSTISTLFKGLDVEEIKTMTSFWHKGQLADYNSLKSITAGEGYLVYMNVSGSLTVSGTQNLQGFKNLEGLNVGWSLIGCPYPAPTPMAGIFGSKFLEVKNFDGFWMPNGTANSIENMEPGKGYFIRK
jgi:xyloglucan-specific exo-beta-1,4-glucanase